MFVFGKQCSVKGEDLNEFERRTVNQCSTQNMAEIVGGIKRICCAIASLRKLVSKKTSELSLNAMTSC